MKKAIYPGSFNPWHDGHADVLRKALNIFDHVIIAVGYNPEKDMQNIAGRIRHVGGVIDNMLDLDDSLEGKVIEVIMMEGLLKDFVDHHGADAVVRGLRNGHDLQYEMNQQYWNEDLGLTIPITYFITDRRFSHISSSAIRMLNRVKRK